MPILLERLSVFGIRDPFSALSHAFGALLAIGATLTLVMRAADAGCSRYAVRRMIWYGVSLVVVFSTSFVFHLPDRPPGDLELYKRLDHAAIFLAIGAATTVVYSLVREPWAETMIRLTWSVAGVALVIKMLVWPMPLWMSAVLYMAVGWIAFAGVWM
ncbi:MAG: hemolysin III family protein, partial [Bacteroidota bacterium]